MQTNDRVRAAAIGAAALVSLAGCSDQAYFVPPAVPVRLAQPLRNVRVFVPHEGALVEARADIYPGMWITVDPDEWPIPERAKAMNIRRSGGSGD